MREFKPAIYFEFLVDVIHPETMETIHKVGDVVLASRMDDYCDEFGIDEFIGRAMYCANVVAYERLTGRDWI